MSSSAPGFKPMTLTEIAAFRVAAINDSKSEDLYVRQMSVGLLRMLDSHEFFREKADRLEKTVEAAAAEGRNVAVSANDVIANEIEEWAARALGAPS